MDMSVFQPGFEKELIEALSQGLPLVKRPYEAIAKQIGSTEDLVIEGIQRIFHRGDIKRFGIIVRHRELGYRANAMVVWDIADELVTETGRCMGRYEFVTLCYQRPRRLPDWPYNLFCMIHGQDAEDVKRQVEYIAEHCGLQNVPRDILFSGRCFKQRGAHYPKLASRQNFESSQAKVSIHG